MLDMFKQESDVDTSTSDRIGGVFESDIIDFKITQAYLDKSKGGANSVNLLLDVDGRTLRVTEYITSGTEKGCKTYYTDKDGKKHALPGWSEINSMCVVATGKDLASQETAKKTLKLYDFEAKAEKPREVTVLASLVDKPVTAAVLHVKEDKYSDPSQKVELNKVVKWYNTKTRQTKDELQGDNEAAHGAKWLKQWKGKMKDDSTTEEATAGAASTPDLFG